jgi:hypothetical protein
MAQEPTPIKLGEITWKRGVSKEPQIELRNRYYEENPTNQIDQVALLSRPALRTRTVVGAGPIREVYYSSGTFDNDMFVVSGDELWRVRKHPVSPDEVTNIAGVIWEDGRPVMSATEEFLFIATGRELFVFDPTLGNVLHQVETPDDAPVISVAYLAGYTFCVIGESQRFYWIKPGEKVIDPLNFAEAERFPDWLLQAMPLGDQVALFGKTTSEFWYPTGDGNAPFQRMQGRTFDRGIWDGTALKVGDSVIVVGADARVYTIDSGPQPISNYAIEEQIRRAMRAQELNT